MSSLDFRKTVTAAGTPELVLADSVAVRAGGEVVLTAETDNAGIVMLGFTDQVSASATTADRKGFAALSAGDTITVPVLHGPDLDLWMDAGTSGEGVTGSYRDPG